MAVEFSDTLDPGQYASLALTHVQYHPSDPLSLPLSLITLAPPFLLSSYATLILVRRELTLIVGLVGQLACEGLNLALKRIFKQGRPTDFLGTGYGMPSSHSQFMGYFMTFWCLHLYYSRPGSTRARKARDSGSSNPLTFIGLLRSAEHLAVVIFIVFLSLATAYSRYHLSYHTTKQILVGFSVGFIFGMAWYYIFESLCNQPISKDKTTLRDLVLNNAFIIALRVRDSWAVWDDGGIEGEYGFWRAEWERIKRQGGNTIDRPSNSIDDSIHLTNMLKALELASHCDATDAAFSVGCVIAISSTGQIISNGYSRQLPGNTHAEEVALSKLESKSKSPSSGSYLRLDLYTTMEPCSERLSKKASCVQRILDFNEAKHTYKNRTLRIHRIFQGVSEPDDFVKCAGTKILQESGLQVTSIQGSNRMKNTKSGEIVALSSGWIEREALRLAKKGHADQAKARNDEERIWQESSWVAIKSILS